MFINAFTTIEVFLVYYPTSRTRCQSVRNRDEPNQTIAPLLTYSGSEAAFILIFHHPEDRAAAGRASERSLPPRLLDICHALGRFACRLRAVFVGLGLDAPAGPGKLRAGLNRGVA